MLLGGLLSALTPAAPGGGGFCLPVQAAHGGPLPPDGTLKRLRKAAVLCIPTGFDLVATALMNVGLLHLNASIYQMLRGASELLFARIFAAIILKRRWG